MQGDYGYGTEPVLDGTPQQEPALGISGVARATNAPATAAPLCSRHGWIQPPMHSQGNSRRPRGTGAVGLAEAELCCAAGSQRELALFRTGLATDPRRGRRALAADTSTSSRRANERRSRTTAPSCASTSAASSQAGRRSNRRAGGGDSRQGTANFSRGPSSTAVSNHVGFLRRDLPLRDRPGNGRCATSWNRASTRPRPHDVAHQSPPRAPGSCERTASLQARAATPPSLGIGWRVGRSRPPRAQAIRRSPAADVRSGRRFSVSDAVAQLFDPLECRDGLRLAWKVQDAVPRQDRALVAREVGDLDQWRIEIVAAELFELLLEFQPTFFSQELLPLVVAPPTHDDARSSSSPPERHEREREQPDRKLVNVAGGHNALDLRFPDN